MTSEVTVATATQGSSGAARTEVPDAVAPPPGNPRYPLLDSLRALAALSIVLVHVGIFGGVFAHASVYGRLIAHLDIGVPIFFLLSGFLLYRPLLATRILGAPRTRISDYARRRFLRIAPAYWLALTVFAVFPGVYGVFTQNWWVYYGLLQNYPVYQASGGCATNGFACGISPTWSLAIEVLFYAALPLFAWGMAQLTARLRGAAWIWIELGALTAVSAVSVLIQTFVIHYSAYLFFSPLGRGWWFGLGMGMAAASVWVAQRGEPPRALRWLSQHPGVAWSVAGMLYVIPSLFLFDPGPALAFPLGSHSQYIAQYLLFGVIGVLVLWPAVFGDRRGGWPRRILAHRALAWLGLISYGIFLWHYPIMLALRDRGATDWWPSMAFPVLAVTTLAITLVCAAGSYYLVERPLMRWKRPRRVAEPPVSREGVRPAPAD